MSNILPENNLSARLLPKTKDFDRFSHRDVMNQTSNYEIIDHIKNKVWGYVSIDNGIGFPNINAKDHFGKTSLDYAILYDQSEIADLLRKHGGKTGEELKAEGN